MPGTYDSAGNQIDTFNQQGPDFYDILNANALNNYTFADGPYGGYRGGGDPGTPTDNTTVPFIIGGAAGSQGSQGSQTGDGIDTITVNAQPNNGAPADPIPNFTNPPATPVVLPGGQPGISLDKSLSGRFQDKYDQLKNTISDPEKLFAFILKSTTGLSKGDDGAWHFDPFAAVGTAANLMTGGAAGIANATGAVDALAKLVGIDPPQLNLTDPLTKPQAGDPAANENGVGEFTPKDPYTTDAQGNQIPDSRDYTAIPQIGVGGAVDSVIVGKNDGSGVVILTPADLTKYGIDPSNMGNYDYAGFFPKDPAAGPPDSQHGAPDINGAYPGEDGYTGTPQTSGTIGKNDTPKTPAAPSAPNVPIPDLTNSGGAQTPAAPSADTSVPPPKDLAPPPSVQQQIPSFQNFAMPDFKLLPNDFGAPMIHIPNNPPTPKVTP